MLRLGRKGLLVVVLSLLVLAAGRYGFKWDFFATCGLAMLIAVIAASMCTRPAKATQNDESKKV